MAPISNIHRFAHNSIRAPHNDVGDAHVDIQLTAGADINLLGTPRADGLNYVLSAPFHFSAPKSPFEPVEIERL